MPHSYRRIYDQLLARMRDVYGLTTPEAVVILGDVLANLEALVGDLAPREDIGLEAGRSPKRVLEAIEAMATQLDSPVLTDLVGEATAALAADSTPLPDRVVEPLQRFVQGLRKVAPEGPGEAPGG